MMVLDKEDGRWRAGVPTLSTPSPPAAARGNTHSAHTQGCAGLPSPRRATGWGRVSEQGWDDRTRVRAPRGPGAGEM